MDSLSSTDSAMPEPPEREQSRPKAAGIACGTDFSHASAQAVMAAAALAKRLEELLLLVHAVDDGSRVQLPGEIRESLCLFERARLQEERDILQAADVEVLETFALGKPEAVLVDAAASHHARLLVVSAHSRRLPDRWLLGSVAERVAETSPVPTLIVRDAVPLTKWLLDGGELRVFVGADFSAQSEAALHWIKWLQTVAPCDVTVALVDSLASSLGQSNAYLSPSVADMLERTERIQARVFRERVHSILGKRRVRIRIERGWGRSDAHLIQMARDESADIIVTGTHQRHGLARLGHHSTSRGVLHYAPMNVACVPLREPPSLHPEAHVR